MTFEETLNYLYNKLPYFQNQGASAFNKSLDKTIQLLEFLKNPHQNFKSIHIAGTNGKGSSSHMIASVLQEARLSTGLYTSPHLKRFTERIKINGIEIENDFVTDFVTQMLPISEKLKPSFFEFTSALCFKYFSDKKIDVAVLEVGMGGKLDSTNVITPLVSFITNISYDHQVFLGDTLSKIASEKAGIIKENIPVVISQYHPETAHVFKNEALKKKSKIIFAQDFIQDISYDWELKGDYQVHNVRGVLTTINELKNHFAISENHIRKGLLNVTKNTGLKGRWQQIHQHPKAICDTGHNPEAFDFIVKQIEREKFNQLHIVFGMVSDKDSKAILEKLPKNALYYFCKPKISRAKDAVQLQEEAKDFGLKGIIVDDVNDAYKLALKNALKDDFIFVGGSTFVVAEIDDL